MYVTCRGFESILQSKREEEVVDQDMCNSRLVSMDKEEAMEEGCSKEEQVNYLVIANMNIITHQRM